MTFQVFLAVLKRKLLRKKSAIDDAQKSNPKKSTLMKQWDNANSEINRQ